MPVLRRRVQSISVSTLVRLPPDEVFDFLTDFQRYAKYSKYLEGVDQYGDGGTGTEYDLHFAWWKLSYTARSRVTELDPPHALYWELVKNIDAYGRWAVEPAPDEVPDDAPGGSRVRLVVNYDPDTVSSRHFDLPRLVPMDYVVDKAVDFILEEGERVVERVVADLEGKRRPVTVVVEENYTDTEPRRP